MKEIAVSFRPLICGTQYLVIRGSAETICWMNVTAYLKTRKHTKSKQITFDGEKLDAPAVWRLRDRYIKRAHAGAVKR
jgi:hypothetical protein